MRLLRSATGRFVRVLVALALGMHVLAAWPSSPGGVAVAAAEEGEASPLEPGLKRFPYLNPVYPGDAPDPAMLRVGDRFYAAVTGQRILVSDDLVLWRDAGPMFDRMPAWVNPGEPHLWAPDLQEIDGRYLLYFSGNERGREGQYMGIGVAWSTRPEGPYRPLDEPLVSGPGFRNIDPAVFRDDDGTLYLYWGSAEQPILVQQLAPDGLSLVGSPRVALRPVPGSRYTRLIEGPWVIKRGEYYYMFVSGSNFVPGEYAVSVARATSPLGPFEYYRGNPILQGDRLWASPGHNAVIQDDAGQDWIVYHAYDWSDTGMGRLLLIDRLTWHDGWPVVERRTPSAGVVVDGPVWRTSSIPRVEAALGAVARASSHQEGRGPELAVDGDRQTAWLPAADDQRPWIVLDLGGALRITRVELAFAERADHRYVIETSLDGSEWTLYADRQRGGAYPYLAEAEATARYVRVRHLAPADARRGLRDVRVYAYQSVWIAEPSSSTPVTSPFDIAVHADDAGRFTQVRILVDDHVVYEGTAPPEGPVQSPGLADGMYRVILEAVDERGAMERHALPVRVANAQILSPQGGARLQGTVTLKLAAGLAAGSHARSEVSLAPVRSGRTLEDEAVVLFEGATPPEEIVVDTTRFEDGAYDLRLRVEAAGERSQAAVRVLVANWERLVDPFEPPVVSPWFGAMDRKKTVAETDGWGYETGDPELFLGDRDRRVWSGAGEGHLIWEAPGMRRFVVSLYVRDVGAPGEVDLSGITVSLSEDQQEWIDLAWQATEAITGSGGWRHVKLRGEAGPGMTGRFVRLLVPEELGAGILQLGEVEWLFPAGP